MNFIKRIAFSFLLLGFSLGLLLASQEPKVDCKIFQDFENSRPLIDLLNDGYSLAYIGIVPKESLRDYIASPKQAMLLAKFIKGDEIKVVLSKQVYFGSNLNLLTFNKLDLSHKFIGISESEKNSIFGDIKIQINENPIPPYYEHKKVPLTEFEKALIAANVELEKYFPTSQIEKNIELDKKAFEEKFLKAKAMQANLKSPKEIEANKNLIAELEKQLQDLIQNSDSIKKKIRDFYSAKSITQIYANKRGEILIEINGKFSLNPLKENEEGLGTKVIRLIYNPETAQIKIKQKE